MSKLTLAEQRSDWSLSAWCIVAAFGAYFCMYAFRVPFAAASYQDGAWWGMQAKTVLVTAQVLGYTVSKFVGIKVIAEMRSGSRLLWLVGLIGVAELALLLFAVIPAPFNSLALFVNGLPLGMVFGLVLSYLEGRRHTEMLTAGLCASFIVADGVHKSVGTLLLEAGVSEAWMPFWAGMLFVPPLILFGWMLARIPAPSVADVVARSSRAPMTRVDRWAFFRRYAIGLILLVLVYLLSTVLRKIRADFAPEIWRALGIDGVPSVFTISEMAVGLAVLLLGGLAICIRDNRRAFFNAMFLAVAGAFLVALALLGLQANLVSPLGFMVLHGLGLYLPYVVIHTTIFERLIAMTRDRGNIGYLMYLADAFGYLGYASVVLGKNFFPAQENFLDFFVPLSWGIASASVLLLVPCWIYFANHPATLGEAGPRPAGLET